MGLIPTASAISLIVICIDFNNVPKILELALSNGVDPLSGRAVALQTGDASLFKAFEDLYAAFVQQLNYVVDLKIRINNYIEQMFATYAPAPFLSVVIADCITRKRLQQRWTAL